MATKKTDTKTSATFKGSSEVKISPRTGKPMQKPRGGNNWLDPKNNSMLEAGDNTKFLTVSMKLAAMPSVDIHDGEAVEQRIAEYFGLYAENDMKPTVTGLGLALGLDRRRLWEIKNGQNVGSSGKPMDLPPRAVDAIKKAYILLEDLWENYMQNGKINPVSGIFLGKNNYGYQDKTEYVLTPNKQQDSDYDAQDIKDRYLPVKSIENKSDTSD